jgi:DNA primase large subunit
MKKLILIIAALVLLPSTAFAQADAEREAVRQAVLDYVEGIYTVDASRIERSVHPELAKRGFFVKKGETAYSSEVMTFQQLVEVAKSFNKSGRLPKDAPKEVVIFDISDQTASAKLTAVWGIDYIHLAKYDGKWKFVNVLWQTPPKPNK